MKQLCDILFLEDYSGAASELISSFVESSPYDFNRRDEFFLDLGKWLKSQPCISEVNIIPGELRSEPGIKQFTFRADQPGKQSKEFQLDLAIFKDKPLIKNIHSIVL